MSRHLQPRHRDRVPDAAGTVHVHLFFAGARDRDARGRRARSSCTRRGSRAEETAARLSIARVFAGGTAFHDAAGRRMRPAGRRQRPGAVQLDCAPQVPGRRAAIWLPALAQQRQRLRVAASCAARRRARKPLRTPKSSHRAAHPAARSLEHQQHFHRPAADAAHLRQPLDDLQIARALQSSRSGTMPSSVLVARSLSAAIFANENPRRAAPHPMSRAALGLGKAPASPQVATKRLRMDWRPCRSAADARSRAPAPRTAAIASAARAQGPTARDQRAEHRVSRGEMPQDVPLTGCHALTGRAVVRRALALGECCGSRYRSAGRACRRARKRTASGGSSPGLPSGRT